MSDKNILQQDVEIPEIVQKKADLAFSQIYARKDEDAMKNDEVVMKKDTKKDNKKVIKFVRRTIAAVAAVAVVFAGIEIYTARKGGLGGDNLFTIKVCAAELKDGNFLPISKDASERQFFYAADWNGNINYAINIPITIEGENIESVTYKMNNAYFEVVSIDGPSIVQSGSANNEVHEASTYTDGYDMAGQYVGKTVVEYYDSFTMDYNVQKDAKYIVNVVDSLSGRMDLYYLLTSNDDNFDFNCSSFTYMLKDEVMTVEVTFKDGTTASKNLGLFGKTALATDYEPDGSEFTYEVMGIFCYDIDSIDDETKKFINDQITSSEIFCFEDGAPSTNTSTVPSDTNADDTSNVSSNVSSDTNDDEISTVPSDVSSDTTDDFEEFYIPDFEAFYSLGNDLSTGVVLSESGKEFRIICGPEDEVGFFDISIQYGDAIEENIAMCEAVVDNILVVKDANTCYLILILAEGGDTENTVVYLLDDYGVREIERYDYAKYDFPDLMNL